MYELLWRMLFQIFIQLMLQSIAMKENSIWEYL